VSTIDNSGNGAEHDAVWNGAGELVDKTGKVVEGAPKKGDGKSSLDSSPVRSHLTLDTDGPLHHSRCTQGPDGPPQGQQLRRGRLR
jgi:hypothetical protein